MIRTKSILSFLALLLLVVPTISAKIWLPSILSDHMVIQRNSSTRIWGWTSAPDETITVTGSWDNKPYQVKAPQGKWSVAIATPEAGGPYTITIKGHETLILKDVLVGEVWLCSGQSNMGWTPKMGLVNAEQEIKEANYPEIRFHSVQLQISDHPQDNSVGKWEACTPESFSNFSSVAYFFGRKLYKELNVPIGLINSSWGGTNVEVWIPSSKMEGHTELQNSINSIPDAPWWPKKPAVSFNAMIHPLVHHDIAGMIWYQGESNRPNAEFYHQAFTMLAQSWRGFWKKDFPIYLAQIAPFNYGSKTGLEGALVHEAQLKVSKTLPHSGLAVTNDIGDLKNIHPENKQDVGLRLAYWALAKNYGKKEIAYSGPVYKEMTVSKKKAIIHFDHAANGLKSKGEVLTEFYIAGSDKKFYKANAKIKGSTVIVWHPDIKEPVAVRFAFSETALPNLYNVEGLPAPGFRTDDWEIQLAE